MKHEKNKYEKRKKISDSISMELPLRPKRAREMENRQ
jgi:hypothetical protein